MARTVNIPKLGIHDILMPPVILYIILFFGGFLYIPKLGVGQNHPFCLIIHEQCFFQNHLRVNGWFVGWGTYILGNPHI